VFRIKEMHIRSLLRVAAIILHGGCRTGCHMRAKITKRAVDALEDGILWDPELRGFGVRARGGGKFYVLKFRSGHTQRWHTIGRHGSPWTPEQARKEARRLLGELATGKIPHHGSTPVATAVAGFIEAHCRHLRSGGQTAALLHRHVISRWGARTLGSIGHGDIAMLLREVQGADKTKRIHIANQVRLALSRFFKWAISEALIPPVNPVAGTEPRRGEIPRERVLTDEEVGKVWETARDWPYGAVVRLLLATGQRRGEVGGMRWSELDLEGRMWRLPKERTKGNREHTVPLNDLAVAILAGCPRIEGNDWVFSTRAKPQAGYGGWSRAKAALDVRCGVSDWRLHDLRRTVATGMQAAGVLPHTVAAVLNHSTAGLFGVTAIYLRDRQEEAKRAAMSVWDRRLRDILGISPETPT
jgi:integrase